MKNSCVKKTAIIILLLFSGIAILIVFSLWKHLSQYVVDGGPHIQLVLEQNRNRNTQPNGHMVGANFVYYGESGDFQYVNIPSLQGVWQLDEPYAKRATVVLDDRTKYISVFCANGKFRTLPNNIHVVRFDISVVTGVPGDSPDWTESVEVDLERHGNFYRIQNPIPNSVYVARTVWDCGVLEHAWIVKEK